MRSREDPRQDGSSSTTPYYKQPELESNGNLQTICMTSVLAPSWHWAEPPSLSVCLYVARPESSEGEVSLLGLLMKDLFLLTSVLLLSHYLSTVASPTINDTKSNKTNIKNMDHAVKTERDNSRQNKVSHLESFLEPAVGIWRKKGK